MLRLFFFFVLFSFSAQAQVVVTIKPLHSLVAGVMQGSGMAPQLLVDGKNSLHDFSLKPSQAAMLHRTDIVFYMGDGFEQFLAKILPQLPAATRRVAMEDAPGIITLPIRGRDGVGASTGDSTNNAPLLTSPLLGEVKDLHAWMSPANARAMVAEIARTLAEIYPEHASLFKKNALSLDKKLATLHENLRVRMATLHGKPFAVFHDATQYFDRAYGLSNIGSIMLHAEHAPGAKHMQELRARIKEMKAVCVFREPEFDAKIVDNLMRGTGAKSALLDPEATLLAPGPDLYFQLMEGIASALENCLSAGA